MSATEIPEVLIIEPRVSYDARGFFVETYHAGRYRAHGIEGPFVQDNHSRSVGGTLRGLHLQLQRPQGKLIRVVEGSIYDIAVDVRRGSPTFARWVAVTLTSDNFKQCFIPPGFAHGFCVLSEVADVEYKCTDVYDRAGEIGIAWNDPALAIPWPIAAPTLSERDRHNSTIAELGEKLPVYEPPVTTPHR